MALLGIFSFVLTYLLLKTHAAYNFDPFYLLSYKIVLILYPNAHGRSSEKALSD
jgi:hypothetical protein